MRNPKFSFMLIVVAGVLGAVSNALGAITWDWSAGPDDMPVHAGTFTITGSAVAPLAPGVYTLSR